MFLKTPREQKIDEFCKEGHLEDYRDLVTRILDDLQNKGVVISARYDVEFSNFETYDDTPEHIRVSLKNVTVPLNVIWILFHEFGHFESPKAKPGDNIIEREELAWNFAEKTLAKYPELLKQKESFEACKKWCLNTYYRRYGI